MKSLETIFKQTKKTTLILSCVSALVAFTDAGFTADFSANETRLQKIAVVNFKACVEKSKLGQQEQETLNAMKKQMEKILSEKEKAINELASKLGDSDYLDSLTPEAETEIKRKYRALTQEATQMQTQYYQSLQQANMKIVQKLAEVIAKASEKIAKEQNIDFVLNEDSAFYFVKDFDISDLVVKEMDVLFEKELKEAKTAPVK